MSSAHFFFAVKRLLFLQAAVVLSIALFFYASIGFAAAASAFLGGLLGFLPNVFFALKFGRFNPKNNPKKIVKNFYSGEAIKLISTALMFVLVFKIPGILVMPLFVGFVLVLTVSWFSLLLKAR